MDHRNFFVQEHAWCVPLFCPFIKTFDSMTRWIFFNKCALPCATTSILSSLMVTTYSTYVTFIKIAKPCSHLLHTLRNILIRKVSHISLRSRSILIMKWCYKTFWCSGDPLHESHHSEQLDAT